MDNHFAILNHVAPLAAGFQGQDQVHHAFFVASTEDEAVVKHCLLMQSRAKGTWNGRGKEGRPLYAQRG